MPTITIENLNNKSITYDDTNQTILGVLHENNIDWMHACGAKGRCTTCKMIVHKGLTEMNKETHFEKQYRSIGQLKPNERLTCQSLATKNIVISVPESSKMPHINYSA